jgi:hypothetical protein
MQTSNFIPAREFTREARASKERKSNTHYITEG